MYGIPPLHSRPTYSSEVQHTDIFVLIRTTEDDQSFFDLFKILKFWTKSRIFTKNWTVSEPIPQFFGGNRTEPNRKSKINSADPYQSSVGVFMRHSLLPYSFTPQENRKLVIPHFFLQIQQLTTDIAKTAQKCHFKKVWPKNHYSPPS